MKLSILAITLLFLTGCGSGGSQGSSEFIGSEESGAMEINKIYAMHSNDKVIKNSTDATIEINHKNGVFGANIKLLSGEAEIIRSM